jgi:dimethylglycine dehydrogenase
MTTASSTWRHPSAPSDPLDGHLDPSGTTHAYCQGRPLWRREIVLHPRLETEPRADAPWDCRDRQAPSTRAVVINAAASGRASVRHGGVYAPLLPCAPYLVTDDIPEIEPSATAQEFPHVMTPGGESTSPEAGTASASTRSPRPCPWTAPLGPSATTLHEELGQDRGLGRLRHRRFPSRLPHSRQARDPRPLHLRPRRQPADRPRPRHAQLSGPPAPSWRLLQGAAWPLHAQWMIHGESSVTRAASTCPRFGNWTTPLHRPPR